MILSRDDIISSISRYGARPDRLSDFEEIPLSHGTYHVFLISPGPCHLGFLLRSRGFSHTEAGK